MIWKRSVNTTLDGSSGQPGALLKISYFTGYCRIPNFTIIILGLGKTTKSQERFLAIHANVHLSLNCKYAFMFEFENVRLSLNSVWPQTGCMRTGETAKREKSRKEKVEVMWIGVRGMREE